MSVSEMLRLACIYAERDQESYLQAWEHCTDAEAQRIKKETAAFIKKLRAYRLKRWGKTQLEAICERAAPVSIDKFAAGKDQHGQGK